MENQMECALSHKGEPQNICCECATMLCNYCVMAHRNNQGHANIVAFQVFAEEKLKNQALCASSIEGLKRFISEIVEEVKPALEARIIDSDYYAALQKLKAEISARVIAFNQQKAKFSEEASKLITHAQSCIKKREEILNNLYPYIKNLIENKNYTEACLSLLQLETLSNICIDDEQFLQEKAASLWGSDPRCLPINKLLVYNLHELQEENSCRINKVEKAFTVIQAREKGFATTLNALSISINVAQEQLRKCIPPIAELIKVEKRKLARIKQKRTWETSSWFVHHFAEGDPKKLYLYDIERKVCKVVTTPYPTIARRVIASAQQDNNIYMSGGLEGKKFLTTTLECSVRGDLTISHRFLANMKEGKDYHSLVAIRNRNGPFLYSLGGYNGARLKTCEVFSQKNNYWEFTAPLPFEWCGLGGCCAVDHKEIYIFDGSLSQKEICCLNTEDAKPDWEIMLYKNTLGWSYSNWGGAIQTNAGEVLVFLQSNKSFVFNNEKHSFDNKYPMPTSDRFIQSSPAIHGTDVYIIGVENEEMFVFSLERKSWKVIQKADWAGK